MAGKTCPACGLFNCDCCMGCTCACERCDEHPTMCQCPVDERRWVKGVMW